MKRIAVLIAVALVTGVAHAQIHRTQTGRELDASPMVGSGGRNPANTDRQALNSQLYITGQVTGLNAFRGDVPYRAAEGIGVGVPSADLGTFRRQSVGLPQVLGGTVRRASPFYEASNTVFGVRGITSGLTVPGGSQPVRSTIAPTLSRRLYEEVTSDYGTLAEQRPQPQMLTAGSNVDASPPGDRAYRPLTTNGFAVAGAEAEQTLSEELALQAESPYRVESRIDRERSGVANTQLERLEDLSPAAGEPNEPGVEQAWTRGGRVPDMPSQRVPETDEDVFFDMMMQLRERRRQGGREPQRDFPTVNAESLDRPIFITPQQAAEPKNLVQRTEEGNVLILRGLAGQSDDAFNKRMASAEEKLERGKYYSAADEYDIAAQMSPGNPLAYAGAGLARFAAGEALSAAIQFRKAMELFPPMMETRLDLYNLLPKRVVDYQLERLKERREDPFRNEAGLTFLAAYMHLNLGHRNRAQQAARDLRAQTPDDELMQAFAHYVLTGEVRRQDGQ
jgi:tetratricopeptide (TPR) repeat protein